MKSSDLKGKSVISVPGGDIIGVVEDVLFIAEEQSVGALVIKSVGFVGLQVVAVKDISSIGEDAVVITSVGKLKDLTRFDKSNKMVSAVEAMGRQVATVSGSYVGKVADVHIDPAASTISGYEVTGGLFARMFSYTHTIAASKATHFGKDLLIVADEVIPVPSESPARE